MGAGGVADSLGLVADALGDELPAQLAGGQWLLIEELSGTRDEPVDVDAFESPSEGPVEHPLDHRLDERPEERSIANGREVDRPTHERQPDGLTIDEQPPELVRVEAFDARPQADVRGKRPLRLEPEQQLGHVRGLRPRPLEQELAGERGAVQRPPAEHLLSPRRDCREQQPGPGEATSALRGAGQVRASGARDGFALARTRASSARDRRRSARRRPRMRSRSGA